ncbi:hypothetical protein KIPB_010801, partial [Kipferlia bialata]
GIGVTKVKTVGDAYEVMRAFTSREMATLSVESIVQSIADMARFSLKMLNSCQESFSASGAPLHVRCGLSVGPAFACVIGSVRVSYDIFGVAPDRARLMEELSPIGNVTVSRDVFELLAALQNRPPMYQKKQSSSWASIAVKTAFREGRHIVVGTVPEARAPSGFIFGDVVTKSPQCTQAIQGLLEKAEVLLDKHYVPSSTDATETQIASAEGALECLVMRSCVPVRVSDPTGAGVPYCSSKLDLFQSVHRGMDTHVSGVVLVGETESHRPPVIDSTAPLRRIPEFSSLTVSESFNSFSNAQMYY